MPNYTLRRIIALFALIGFVVTLGFLANLYIADTKAHPCVAIVGGDYCLERGN